MSMKTALLALANNIGMCQENSRSIKLELARGFSDMASGTINPWMLVKTETGSVDIDIPEGANEILAICDISNHTVSIVIPTAILGETDKSFMCGGYSSAETNALAILKANSSKIKLGSYYYNGTSFIASATTTLYYR